VDRIFLDANVLFSAAYRAKGGVRRLWELEDVELITSDYALEEAMRNLETNEQCDRLRQLVESTTVLPTRASDLSAQIPEAPELPEKDVPILMAAARAGATHLITGDFRHFGIYFGRQIKDVLILPPAKYLQDK